MMSDTCGTSRPLAQTSVEMSTRLWKDRPSCDGPTGDTHPTHARPPAGPFGTGVRGVLLLRPRVPPRGQLRSPHRTTSDFPKAPAALGQTPCLCKRSNEARQSLRHPRPQLPSTHWTECTESEAHTDQVCGGGRAPPPAAILPVHTGPAEPPGNCEDTTGKQPHEACSLTTMEQS